MPRSSPSISNPKTEPIGGTEDNIADIFTKPISGSKFQEKLTRCNPIQIIT